uniref:Cadherin domain-containing protein n=1 Tax=Denticeps clupeoides TaxID=299321 RepID=A0AAY4AB03_9TELE
MDSGALLLFLLLLCVCGRAGAQVSHLRLSVEEGLPAGTVVGDIRAALPRGTRAGGFFISESGDSHVFRDLEIHGDTGIISTAVVLDRESRDEYEFAAATLTGDVVRVTVAVEDVNDHSPVFPSEIVALAVSELSPPGTTFELEGARDQDVGSFGTQGYQIINSDMAEMFKVGARGGGGGLDLVLLGRLDRESRDFYNLTVEAFDGGVPRRTGRLQVHVNVSDENDNPPVFDRTEYRAAVRENAPRLTPVCRVQATDLDLGVNSLLTYEIVRRQGDPSEHFLIDESTGVIRVNKPLDREAQTFYELIVRARDGGTQPESSSTFVGIRVLDVNDNSPTINILFLSESGEPQVSEGAALEEYVARISASDPDLGEGNKVHVYLQGGEGKFLLKQTDEFLYAMCVAGELDREMVDLYELKVVALDFGEPPLQSETTVLVRVLDVNDNAPVFGQEHYEVHVPEDAAPGSSLVQVTARDKDEGFNSELRFSIPRSRHGHLVHIHPESGLVTSAAHLDREREAEVHFLVVAVDGGSPPQSSTATVTVYVEDVNDNKPVFDQPLYNASVVEHTAAGTCVLQVRALDSDGGDFGKVRYFLSDGFNKEDQRSLFHINPATGEICVDQDIDRDAGIVTYDLLVKAEDWGGLGTQAYVHIEVEDLNDNAPVFNPEKYVTSVSSHAMPGTEILNVIAADRDSGSYGEITYNIVPGDSSSFFSVDKSSGAVTLSSSLSSLGSASVKFSISAKDGDGRAATQPADVTVNIFHSSHVPALFQKWCYSFSVPEDAPVGSAVGTVQAVTPSNSVESPSYRISSGDPSHLFSVDPRTGLIYTSQTLDHETLPTVLLSVQAHASDSPVHSSTQVNVTIDDINDNSPVFPWSSNTISVSQNTLPGTVLFIAHAHDRDSGSNGKIQYSLKSEHDLFSIDPLLGMLSLNSDLSSETQILFKVKIVAQDEGSPSLTSTMTLTVEVDPSSAAEETLAFETLVYQVEISENAQRDTRVLQVRAHGGSHDRGPITASAPGFSYKLENLSGSSAFIIHPDSGWMFLSESLDYETTPSYHFSVRATAQGSKVEVSATATVVVKVLDENDNAPVFTRERYFFTVEEGPSPLGLVGTVKASDRDSGRNGHLSYILLSDGKHFRHTGVLVTTRPLDRERSDSHAFIVTVTDGVGDTAEARQASVLARVYLQDVNDNSPGFASSNATLVPEDAEVGSLVHQVIAMDPDEGENGQVMYSLIYGNESGLFLMEETGECISCISECYKYIEKRAS